MHGDSESGKGAECFTPGIKSQKVSHWIGPLVEYEAFAKETFLEPAVRHGGGEGSHGEGGRSTRGQMDSVGAQSVDAKLLSDPDSSKGKFKTA